MSIQAQNMLITGGTFSTIHPSGSLSSLSAFERLEKATAHAGFHDSIDRPDPPRCHPRTRLAIQAQINAWIHRQDDPDISIMWLTGGAGAGKSAIAQCIAEQCKDEGCLAAAFFFGRSDPARNDGRKLIATIAYQICLNIPGARERVEAVINHDPLIFTRSLASQMQALIVDPLRQLQTNGDIDLTHIYAVIIDGLDECHGHDTQCNILITIADAISQTSLPLRFLVASRPESQITRTFVSRKLAKLHTRRTLDETFSPDQDIETFLRDSFDEIKETHTLRSYIPSNWPSDSEIQFLIWKASGQFIYASVVIKYVKSPRRRPKDCLDNILCLRPISRDMPFAELDSLYRHMLEDVEDIEITMKILSFFILGGVEGRFISNIMCIEYFLCLSPGDIHLHLDNLTSIIKFSEEGLQPVSISHASFSDFLLDKRRSTNFFIDPPVRFEALARTCFHHLSNKEPIHHVDSDPDTKNARRTSISYSQMSIKQLCAMSVPTPELCTDISEFSIFDVYAVSEQYRSEYSSELFDPLEMWRFINSIGTLKLEGGKAIMNRHLQDMRTFIIQELGVGFSTDVKFAIYISISNVIRPRHITAYPRILATKICSIQDPSSTDQSIPFTWNFSLMFRLLINHFTDSGAFVPLLRECIKEREEQAMHPLDRGKYAITAVGIFKLLSSEDVRQKNSESRLRYSFHDLNIRRKQPFKWRRKRFGIHGTLFSTRLYRWRNLPIRHFSGSSRFRINDADEIVVNTNVLRGELQYSAWMNNIYRPAISIIPDLLDRCDYNPELIHLAKTVSFPYQLLSFRKERAAPAAIHKYLRRVLPDSDHSIL